MSRMLAALRAEPVMRSYLIGSLLDDLGIAASGWAWQLLAATLFVDQRTRASVMMPTLLCFVLGALIGGPLADWGGKIAARAGLARYRWRVLIAGRAIETLALFGLALSLIGQTPTLGRLLPYFLISALMKTGLRPTRIAFEVDLLKEQAPRLDPDGSQQLDENGHALFYKTHYLKFASWLAASTALASVVGLLIGGQVMAGVGGQVWILALVDVITNLVFLFILATRCRPAALPAAEGEGGIHVAGSGFARVVFRELFTGLKQTFDFLFHKSRRPLLVLLTGSMLIEAIQECYDGRMIIRQLLGASDDGLRYSELGWMVAALGSALALPWIAERVRTLGRLFLVMMLIDGVCMFMAGRAAGAGIGASVLPFALVISLDRGLTSASSTLADLAQNSASSTAMRGRLAASYALVVLVMDIVAQGVATGLAESVGIPSMLSGLGVGQIGVILLLALLGGRALWNFRIGAPKSKNAATPVLAPEPG